VVNETLARYSWGRDSALGKRLQINDFGPKATWYTVVGVVKDVRERGIQADLKAGVYMLVDQVPEMWNVPYALIVRTQGDPALMANSARQAIWSVDREQPVSGVSTMEEIIDTEVANQRQEMILLSTFAVLALVLASLGIYGVLAYLVSQRTREMGLRMALGARPGELVRMMVMQGSRLAGIGLVIGTLAALWFAKLMATLVYGVGTADPFIFASMAAVLGIVSVMACVAPARKAARVDPAIALREE
jgi:putative ABC transport system permease protein